MSSSWRWHRRHDARCRCEPWQVECDDPEAEIRALISARWPRVSLGMAVGYLVFVGLMVGLYLGVRALVAGL